MSRKHENEHPDLVKLCTNCPDEDCDGEPCEAYKAMARMLRTGRRAEGSPPYRATERAHTQVRSYGHDEKIGASEEQERRAEGSPPYGATERAHTQVRPYRSEASGHPVKERRPAIMFAEIDEAEDGEEIRQNRISLAKYNAAIDALAGLTDDDFFSSSAEIGTANGLLMALRIERRERFESLVDWKRIAEG